MEFTQWVLEHSLLLLQHLHQKKMVFTTKKLTVVVLGGTTSIQMEQEIMFLITLIGIRGFITGTGEQI